MYEQRTISYLETWEPSPWKLKVYGIAYRREKPEIELIQAAKRAAESDALLKAAENYGVGFIGIHQGMDSNFVFVDWWANGNELHHHVYISPPENIEELKYQSSGGPVACVWDLYLIGFERQAWVETVLMSPEPNNYANYLARQFNGRV